MGALLTYPEGPQAEPVRFECANGFVARVVSPVSHESLGDAEALALLLNEFYARGGRIEGHYRGSIKIVWPKEITQ